MRHNGGQRLTLPLFWIWLHPQSCYFVAGTTWWTSELWLNKKVDPSIPKSVYPVLPDICFFSWHDFKATVEAGQCGFNLMARQRRQWSEITQPVYTKTTVHFPILSLKATIVMTLCASTQHLGHQPHVSISSQQCWLWDTCYSLVRYNMEENPQKEYRTKHNYLPEIQIF